MRGGGTAAIAREVLVHGPISRAELTERLGLSPASLTRLTRPLVDSGLLVELDERADGSVGRPSRPLDVPRDAGTFAGVTLTGGQRLHAVATDMRAGLLGALDRPLTARDPDGVVDEIAAAVADVAPGPLTGVGVSLGAQIEGGSVVHGPYLDWVDVPFQDLLRRRLGVPAAVENDLVALAESERWFGVGKDTPGFAVVTVGSGIGLSLVAHGEVVRSADSGVGTAGHLRLSAQGPMCPEGHVGCAGALLTIAGITGQVSVALGRAVGYDEVLTLAAEGHPVARRVVEAAGAALGTFVALTADLTLQSTVVLAGDGVALYDVVGEQVADVVRELRNPRARPVTIHPRSPGYDAWARGAAVVAIQAATDRIGT